MIEIQILGILFGAGMIYLSFLHYKKKYLRVKDFSMWIFIWIVMIVSVVFHDSLSILIQPLKVSRFMDLIMITAFMALFLIVFIIYGMMRKNERDIKRIIRESALKGH